MSKLLKWMCVVTLTIGCACTSPTTKTAEPAVKALSPQEVVDECTTPHEVYQVPPSILVGTPVLVVRHADCMGQPSLVVAIWPGANDKLHTLYIGAVIEKYAMYLKLNGEYFDAEHVATSQITSIGGQTGPKSDLDAVPTFAAVFRLNHTPAPPEEEVSESTPDSLDRVR